MRTEAASEVVGIAPADRRSDARYGLVGPQQPRAAKQFIEFLGEPENINRWAEAVAAIPLKRDSSSRIDPVLDPFLPFIDDGKADPFMDQRWPNAEVQPTHFAVIQQLLGGKLSVDGALEKMDEAYAKKS